MAVLRAVVVVAAADAARPTVPLIGGILRSRLTTPSRRTPSFGARASAAFVDAALALGATIPAVLVLLFGPSHDDRVLGRRHDHDVHPTGAGTLTFSAALLGAAIVGYTLW